MTWSSTSSTCSSSLLNQITYCFSDSPSTCWMLRKWPVGFLCVCPLMRWWTKPLLSCSKFTIVPRCILLNHTLAAPFSVVGNALHITSMIQCDPRGPWNRHMTPAVGDRISVGGDGSVLQWWMVSLSFESSHPNSSYLYPSGHFLIHSSPSSCCEAHFPSWRNLLLRSYLACWLENLILHFHFHLFANAMHFGISLSFAALHSGKLALPH